jgi:hypothetical protein
VHSRHNECHDHDHGGHGGGHHRRH